MFVVVIMSQLRTVRNLAHLKALEVLDLSDNSIPTVDALRALTVNTSLRALAIKGNPVGERAVPQAVVFVLCFTSIRCLCTSIDLYIES
jgi:hypothetical protein